MSLPKVNKPTEEGFDVVEVELAPPQLNLSAVDGEANGTEDESGGPVSEVVDLKAKVKGSYVTALASFLANNKTTITATITMLVVAVAAAVVSVSAKGAAAGQKLLQLQAFEESTLDGYVQIPGEGECEDISGNLYSYVGYYDVLTKEDCARLCAVCPGHGDPNPTTGLTYRGFELRVDEDECYCLVDYGPSFDDTLCDNDETNDEYDVGTGEIVGVDGNDEYLCWKFVGFGSSKSSKTSGYTSKSPKSSTSPLNG